MRYLLDDLRIDEESGVVCVGIIDLDAASSDALSQRSLPRSAPLWRNVADGPLTSLRRQLQLTSQVRYIVHSGGDAYAVATTAGDVRELHGRSDPDAVALVERIAAALGPHVVSGPHASGPRGSAARTQRAKS